MSWQDYQRAFYNRIRPYLPGASQRTGIPQDVIFAQAALESNWGRSAPNNNFFGIKGEGGSQTTREFVNGRWVTIQDNFRGYSSIEESVNGYVDFITNPNSRRWTTARNAGTVTGAISGIAAGGYATDPQYATKLNQIVNNIPRDLRSTTTATNTQPGASVPFTGANAVGSGLPTLPSLEQWGRAALDNIARQGGNVAGSIGETVDGAVEAVTNPVEGFLDFFRNLFSQDTAIRFIVVLVGLAAVVAAFASLVITPSNATRLVKGIKNVAS